MSGNYQRTPLGPALSRLARAAAQNELQQGGKSLPVSVKSVSGQFLTLQFEVNSGPFTIQSVTVPTQTSLYDWIPWQPGDTGVVQPANVHLAGISGEGGALPNLEQSANLTALSFAPVAKKGWTVPDPNQRVVQGPNGVLLRDTGAASSFNLTPSSITQTSDSITLTAGGHTIVINSSGITLDGIVWLTHQHTLVTTGTEDSGPPLV
jgi:hypothetical protein